MGNEGKALLLFQLGPVQEFIAQAETVGDLRAGSEILSRLTAAALRSLAAHSEDIVFPAIAGNPDLAGIPNRFLVYVPRAGAQELAQNAADAARKELVDLAKKARKSLPEKLRISFDRQIDAFLQTTWAVLVSPSVSDGRNYADISKLMAMRRNTREFTAWPEEAYGQAKDFLSGKEVALQDGRGAINLVKASMGMDMEKRFDSDAYIAVIAMDGDWMGRRLSTFETADEYRKFSSALSEFADKVRAYFDEIRGVLIYAGGDDVLAIVPAGDAIEVAKKLRTLFVEKLNSDGQHANCNVTASTGIAVGSVQDPLQDLVHVAHAAESRAKHVYDRDALALNVMKRSGEQLEWGCKWESEALKLYRSLADARRKKDNGLARFAYKLTGFLEPYALQTRDEEKRSVFERFGDMRQVVLEETLYTLRQTAGSEQILSRDMLERYLAEPLILQRPEDYLGLFLVEAFINRSRS